ncbi:hypothetical protein PybrP1_005704 [[Pythium] brassicae (nom. inval.)]|nr:hypothetical protein PybrP1_005704 [[Pythium] brassicae (nom. inval.)]
MASQGIQVSCRVRDALEPEGTAALSVDEARRVLAVRGVSFACFNGVFLGGASQATLFARVGEPLVADLLRGFNCTLLAYGPTGSGKTFRTGLKRLFAGLTGVDAAQCDVALTASFVEVYQETLRDLLAGSGNGSCRGAKPLRIREDRGERGVAASGLAVLARGDAQRATDAARMNADSSRSHAVFALTLTRTSTLRGRLLFVYLAGSEKPSKTVASGTPLDKAKHINRYDELVATLQAKLGRLLDILMQEDVNSLRRAVAQLQSGRYEAEHARRVAYAMAQRRLACEEAEKRRVEATSEQLRADVKQQQQAQRRRKDEQSAET